MRLTLRLALTLLTVATLLSLLPLTPAEARRRRAQLVNVSETSWFLAGDYKVRARRVGLVDSYTLTMFVDFFSDGTFTAQDCVFDSINETCVVDDEAEFFSGIWSQNDNKIFLEFDALSQLILADIFRVQEEAALGEPVEVSIRRWDVRCKLKLDLIGQVFLKYKEKLRHDVINRGIPIRMKTNGRGEGDILPPEPQP